VSRIEKYLAAAPDGTDVLAWRLHEIDLWPLFKTCLLSLAVLMDIRQKKGPGIYVGNLPWRAGVLADHYLVSNWCARRSKRSGHHGMAMPPDQLKGQILYLASKVQARMLAGLLVSAPFDIPATLMHRAGYTGVIWYEDLGEGDEQLAHALNPPAQGVSSVLAAAYLRSCQPQTGKDLKQLPGFLAWCAGAAQCLGLSPRFLQIWLARQVNIARATMDCYGQIFDQRGPPSLLVMLNSGFATTVGITAAARSRDIRVVEVHHGEESESALTAPHQEPYFSRFNSAPDALISWELTPRRDEAVLSIGPIGLHLPSIFTQNHEADLPPHKALSKQLTAQIAKLATHARKSKTTHEILVSLQPGDDARWLARAALQNPDCLFWVRRHGADLSYPLPELASSKAPNIEFELASKSVLPLLLDRVGLHLTRFSAVALEAAACGVPTLATEPYALALYERHISPQLLTMEADEEALPEAIGKLLAENVSEKHRPLPDIEQIVPFLERYISK